MFVKSIEAWLHRNYPSVPLYSVHLTQESIDHSKLNPYRARVIILWKPDGPHRQHIIGFFEYGKVDMLFDFPVPKGFARRPNFHYDEYLSIDQSKEMIEQGTVYPPLDWLLLMMGVREPEHGIPYSFVQWANLRNPFSKIEPTLQDLQNHYPAIEPECWFNVPLEYCPNTLANSLILYPGAKVHVSSDDIWQVLRPQEPIKNPTEQMRILAGFTKRAKKERNLDEIDSLEQARPRMAPCIQRIVDSPSFPSDIPRQYLVRVLKRGNVSLGVVESILDQKNASSTPTQRRWDYKAHYEKSYAPPSCEKMNACSLCPLAPGQSLDVKKSACFKLFMDSFPDKQPYAKSFYGPGKWFEW